MTSAKFRTNGGARSVWLSAFNVAQVIGPDVHADVLEIIRRLGELSVGGVTSFETRNVADAGGKTEIFVERLAD